MSASATQGGHNKLTLLLL